MMLKSNVLGIKIKSLTTSLPSEKKIGKDGRFYYVADELQTTSDLGYDAAERLLAENQITKEEIGILLFGSKTPDYRSPNTAAILQGRLEMAIDCICFDTNVGSNGLIKMTQIASALLAKSNSKYALIIVGDTPSKLKDGTVEKEFEISDAATALLLEKSTSENYIEFKTYTAGSNFKGLTLKEGGFRNFDPQIAFDGSKSENYIVKSDEEDFKNFFVEIEPVVHELKVDSTNLIHSILIDTLKFEDEYKANRLIKADASELALLLENILNNNKSMLSTIQFISAGEGMALMALKTNHIPQVFPKNYTLAHFEEAKISHEM